MVKEKRRFKGKDRLQPLYLNWVRRRRCYELNA
jgi:hypothetical protein